MVGFMYRTAIAVKDFGERHKLPWLIRLGLWIREWAIDYSFNIF
jgi:hypothetical protein